MPMNDMATADSAATGNNDGFSWQVRVYYEDTDAHGIVYHGSYVRFLDRARTEWLRAAGVDMQELHESDNLLFVVRSLQIMYHKPVQYGTMLQLISSTDSRTRSSILLSQRILTEDGSCVCEAKVRVVCIDATERRPRPLPPQIEELCQ